MSSVRSATSAAHRGRAMPDQGPQEHPSMLGAAVLDSQLCHRPKGSLAHTPHSSH